MKRMNFGCGFDIKEDWTNVDVYHSGVGVTIWDGMSHLDMNGIRYEPQLWDYDFILVNHVLCTMKPEHVKLVLRNLYESLKDGGKIQIIDMDLTKVFNAYERGDADSIPIEQGDIDSRLCYAISGYGTRLSHYTDKHLQNLLLDAGFSSAIGLDESEYDTRPKESLIVEATK